MDKILLTTLIGGLTAGLGLCLGRRLLQLVSNYSTKRAARGIKGCDIRIVTSCAEWEELYQDISRQTAVLSVVGLDCEYVMKASSNTVALLQLATPDRLVILLRLCQMDKDVMPLSLETFLADRRILKVGVGVLNDGRKLTQDFGLTVAGCVDLRHLVPRVKQFRNLTKQSLKDLAQEILNVQLVKTPGSHSGDWGAARLSPSQIEYAVADAQVGVDIFMKLALANVLDYIPDSLHPKDAGISEEEFWDRTQTLHQGLVDVSSPKRAHSTEQSGSHEVEKRARIKSGQSHLNSDCYLLSRDGRPLCTCGEKEAEWYITRGLADIVRRSPLTVRLNFPTGANRPASPKNRSGQDKEKVCVVCGAADMLVRKFVIPREYKNYFPTATKGDNSLDRVLLCKRCHQVSADHDQVLRSQLATECQAPLASKSNYRYIQDPQLARVKSAARILKSNKDEIPIDRVLLLEETVMEFYSTSCVTEEMLTKALEINDRMFNPEYYPHGRKVVECMMETNRLESFQQRWRRHFLDTMGPKFLPQFWSVDHGNARPEVKQNISVADPGTSGCLRPKGWSTNLRNYKGQIDDTVPRSQMAKDSLANGGLPEADQLSVYSRSDEQGPYSTLSAKLHIATDIAAQQPVTAELFCDVTLSTSLTASSTCKMNQHSHEVGFCSPTGFQYEDLTSTFNQPLSDIDPSGQRLCTQTSSDALVHTVSKEAQEHLDANSYNEQAVDSKERQKFESQVSLFNN